MSAGPKRAICIGVFLRYVGNRGQYWRLTPGFALVYRRLSQITVVLNRPTKGSRKSSSIRNVKRLLLSSSRWRAGPSARLSRIKLHSFTRQPAHSTFRQNPKANSNRETRSGDIPRWRYTGWRWPTNNLGETCRSRCVIMNVWLMRAVALVALLTYGCGLGRGQSVPVLRGGELEATVIGGFNFGGILSSVSTTAVNTGAIPLEVVSPSSNGSIGLQFGASLSRRLVFTAEWDYIAGGRIEYTQDYYLAQLPPTTLRISVDAHASTMEFSGGAQVLFPLKKTARIIPYLCGGAGALRSAGDLTYASIGGAPGQNFSGRFRTYHSVVDAGPGLRYYFSEHVGFRVEGRYYNARVLRTFGRVGFGVFFRFR